MKGAPSKDDERKNGRWTNYKHWEHKYKMALATAKVLFSIIINLFDNSWEPIERPDAW